MKQIIGVSPGYYELTHKVVSELNDSGLEHVAEGAKIPLEKLREFKDTKKLDGQYIPSLYSDLFDDKTPLEVHNFLKTDLEGYVKFLNEQS